MFYYLNLYNFDYFFMAQKRAEKALTNVDRKSDKVKLK